MSLVSKFGLFYVIFHFGDRFQKDELDKKTSIHPPKSMIEIVSPNFLLEKNDHNLESLREPFQISKEIRPQVDSNQSLLTPSSS